MGEEGGRKRKGRKKEREEEGKRGRLQREGEKEERMEGVQWVV